VGRPARRHTRGLPDVAQEDLLQTGHVACLCGREERLHEPAVREAIHRLPPALCTEVSLSPQQDRLCGSGLVEVAQFRFGPLVTLTSAGRSPGSRRQDERERRRSAPAARRGRTWPQAAATRL
jgi:hypothetical protein